MKARKPETPEPIHQPHPTNNVLDENVTHFQTDTTKATKLGTIILTSEPHPTINVLNKVIDFKPDIIGARKP